MQETQPTDAPQAAPAESASAAPAAADLSPAACGQALAERFPAVFGAGRVQPLKLRIQADIQQRAPGVFTRRSLSAFLHRHTTGNAYLRALAKAAQRVDLDGQPAGEVAAEHRQAALAELERRRAIHQQRQAAQAAAQRAAQHEAVEAEGRARAERAALLRAHEASTLTRRNFCALKGIAEEALDALLEQARRERAQNLQPRQQTVQAVTTAGPRRG